jgi:hypothetical protein
LSVAKKRTGGGESDSDPHVCPNVKRTGGEPPRLLLRGSRGVPNFKKEKHNDMTSRTPEGKHTKRFIIEFKNPDENKYSRSCNRGLSGFFYTREEAQAALAPEKDLATENLTYRVRQK